FVEHRVDPADRRILRKWRTIGIGESHLAQIVEPILATQTRFGLEVAYRAHAPYVELKIRHRAADAAALTLPFAELEQAMGDRLFEKDRDDHTSDLIQ